MSRSYKTLLAYLSITILLALFVARTAAAVPVSNTFSLNISSYNLSVNVDANNQINYSVSKLQGGVLQAWKTTMPYGCKAAELKWTTKQLVIAGKPLGWLSIVAPGCCCASNPPTNLKQTQQRNMALAELITVNGGGSVTYRQLQGKDIEIKPATDNKLQITYFQFTGSPALNLVMPHSLLIDAEGVVQQQELSTQEIETILTKKYPKRLCMTARLLLSQCQDQHPNDPQQCLEQKVAQATCISQSTIQGE